MVETIKNAELLTTLILHKFGMPKNLRGFHYLREAIVILEDYNECVGVTKILYPQIAKKHSTSVESVERAIRHAINVTWERGNGGSFESEYKYIFKRKPSNSELIACIADEVYLNLKYEK